MNFKNVIKILGNEKPIQVYGPGIETITRDRSAWLKDTALSDHRVCKVKCRARDTVSYVELE